MKIGATILDSWVSILRPFGPKMIIWSWTLGTGVLQHLMSFFDSPYL